MNFKFNFLEKIEVALYLIAGILFLFGMLNGSSVLIVRAFILVLVAMILQILNMLTHCSRFFQEPKTNAEERIERLRMHGRIADPEKK